MIKSNHYRANFINKNSIVPITKNCFQFFILENGFLKRPRPIITSFFVCVCGGNALVNNLMKFM